MTQQQKPIAKFRAGSVSGALWENEATIDGRKTTMVKATLERRYKDASGQWRSSNSFGRNEAFLAIFVLQRAIEAMVERDNARGETAIIDEELARE